MSSVDTIPIPEGEARLPQWAESLLSIVAWILTTMPSRTPRGCVRGKIVIGSYRIGRGDSPQIPDPPRSTQYALDAAASGRGFGRTWIKLRRNLRPERGDTPRRDRDDRWYTTGRLPDGVAATVGTYWVTPSKEVAICRVITLRRHVARWMFRERDGWIDEQFLVECVPYLRLAAAGPGASSVIDVDAPPLLVSLARELSDRLHPINNLHDGPNPVAPQRVLVLDTDFDDRVPELAGVGYFGNFVDIGPDPEDNTYTDLAGPDDRDPGTHGTMVAATIRALSPYAELAVGRVQIADGELTSSTHGDFVLAGLLEALGAEEPFDLINISHEDDRPRTNVRRGRSMFRNLSKTIDLLGRRGTVVIAATGNKIGSTIAAGVSYPAKDRQVVAVGSLNFAGERSRFSRFSNVKPEVVAVGGECDENGNATEWLLSLGNHKGFGTSFACAVATGYLSRRNQSATAEILSDRFEVLGLMAVVHGREPAMVA